MECVEGSTLRAFCEARGRRAADVIQAFVQAGRGLHEVHRAGLVHRDFKPDNALVGADGRVRVTDFGLVGLAEDEGRRPARRRAPGRAHADPARSWGRPRTWRPSSTQGRRWTRGPTSSPSAWRSGRASRASGPSPARRATSSGGTCVRAGSASRPGAPASRRGSARSSPAASRCPRRPATPTWKRCSRRSPGFRRPGGGGRSGRPACSRWWPSRPSGSGGAPRRRSVTAARRGSTACGTGRRRRGCARPSPPPASPTRRTATGASKRRSTITRGVDGDVHRLVRGDARARRAVGRAARPADVVPGAPARRSLDRSWRSSRAGRTPTCSSAAVTAAGSLPLLDACADAGALRAAVPLPAGPAARPPWRRCGRRSPRVARSSPRAGSPKPSRSRPRPSPTPRRSGGRRSRPRRRRCSARRRWRAIPGRRR